MSNLTKNAFIFFQNALNTTNNSRLHKKSFFEIKVGRKSIGLSTEKHFITNNKYSATFFLHSFSVLKFTSTSVQLCTLPVDSVLITQTNSKYSRTLSNPICTMLQKLSKCEVKVHYTRIDLPLNFAWNQFWQDLNVKNCHFYNFRDSQLWILVNLGLEKWLKYTKIKIQYL